MALLHCAAVRRIGKERRIMLHLLVRDYRMANQTYRKKALIISFKNRVTGENFRDYGKQLTKLLQKNYNAYIFYLPGEDELSSFTLKLMIAFSNTSRRKTGLLMKNMNEELYGCLYLDSLFVVNTDMKQIIMQLEKYSAR
jgi:hypothetical protein